MESGAAGARDLASARPQMEVTPETAAEKIETDRALSFQFQYEASFRRCAAPP